MKALFSVLCEVLSAQAESYQDLLGNLEAEFLILSRLSPEELEENNRLKERIIDRIQHLESRRVEAVNSLAALSGLSEDDLTLTKLIRTAPSPWNGEFERLRNELLEMIRLVTERNERNRNLMVCSSRLFKDFLGTLTQGPSAGRMYRPGGTPRSTETGQGLLVSKSV